MISARSTAAAALGAVFLSACGAGGGSGASALVPNPAKPNTGVATLSISVPVGSPVIAPRAGTRRTAYVSPGTKNVAVYVNGAAAPSATLALPAPSGSPATYTVNVNAPYGNDSFRVDLLDANAVALSTGTVTNVTIGPSNAIVDITPLGIPALASFGVSDANGRPPLGAATTIPLNLLVADADGYPIHGTFARRVTLTVVPPFAYYTLSSRYATSEADQAALSLTFDGTTDTPGRVYVTLNDSTDAIDAVAARVIRPGAAPAGRNALVLTNAGTTSSLTLIDTATYAVTPVIGFNVNGTALATAPDGKTSYVGLANGAIRVYDGLSRTIVSSIATGASAVIALAFSDQPSSSSAFALVTKPGSTGVLAIDTAFRTAGTYVALPAAATGCGGIATPAYAGATRSVVSCTDATYLVDTQTSVVSLIGGGAGGRIVDEPLSPGLVYAASAAGSVTVAPGPGGAAVTGGSIPIPGGSGASGLSLEPSQRFLYVGTTGAVKTIRVLPGGSGSVSASAAVPGTVTALADFPGSAAAPPDATVWGADSNGTVVVIDPRTNTTVRTIGLTGVPVDLVFVP
ncbi:MAG: hypothetical protein NVSMB64_10030 [Candidatus Velthaea sp.]